MFLNDKVNSFLVKVKKVDLCATFLALCFFWILFSDALDASLKKTNNDREIEITPTPIKDNNANRVFKKIFF